MLPTVHFLLYTEPTWTCRLSDCMTIHSMSVAVLETEDVVEASVTLTSNLPGDVMCPQIMIALEQVKKEPTVTRKPGKEDTAPPKPEKLLSRLD